MKLTVKKRTGATRGEVKAIRRVGNLPAVIYGPGVEGEKIFIEGPEFQACLRQIKQKHKQIATTIFELDSKKALIKDIQYHPVTYAIEHIDFFLLTDDKPITVNVPIQINGIADCTGIKLGGTLRQVIRTLKVSCLPSDIPNDFQIDIRDLGLGQSIRLSDIAIPSNVRPLALMNEVAVVIAKGKGAA